MPCGDITRFTSEKDNNINVTDIFTILVTVKIHQVNHNICENIYRSANTDKYVELIQRLIETPLEFHVNSINKNNGSDK